MFLFSINKKLFCYYFFSILIGLSSIFAFAPYYYHWVMPIILVCLFYSLEKIEDKHRNFVFAVWCFTFHLINNYWLVIAMHDIALIPLSLAILCFIIFVLFLSSYLVVGFYFLNRLCRYFNISDNYRLVVLSPIVWVSLEYLRSFLFTGYGWGEIGYTQIPNSILSSLAPIGGIHLVTYFLLLFCYLVVVILFTKKLYQKIIFIILLFIIVSTPFYLKNIKYTVSNGVITKVALLQGDILQEEKFTEDMSAFALNMYYEELLKLENIDIAILPEVAITYTWNELPKFILSSFNKLMIDKNMDLAIGTVVRDKENNVYNAVVKPQKNTEQYLFYAKNHLVPFGEFKPLENFFSLIYEKLLSNIDLGNLTKGGSNQKALPYNKQNIAFNICYEDSFGDELIPIAKTSTILANVSNMSWYGNSNAMDLQIQHSQARAIEFGRYMLRATNNGRTAIISPNGNIIKELPRDKRDVLIGYVEGRIGNTPYMIIGSSWIKIFLIFVIMITVVFILIKNRNNF